MARKNKTCRGGEKKKNEDGEILHKTRERGKREKESFGVLSNLTTVSWDDTQAGSTGGDCLNVV